MHPAQSGVETGLVGNAFPVEGARTNTSEPSRALSDAVSLIQELGVLALGAQTRCPRCIPVTAAAISAALAGIKAALSLGANAHIHWRVTEAVEVTSANGLEPTWALCKTLALKKVLRVPANRA